MSHAKSHNIKHHIKQQSTWKRGLYMLLFTVFYQIAEILLFVMVLIQFVIKLLTGDTNQRLRQLGQSLATYIYQIVQFLSFNSEMHPYPFGEWPMVKDTDINNQTNGKTEVDEILKKVEQDDVMDKD